jgi:hypothetical protein
MTYSQYFSNVVLHHLMSGAPHLIFQDNAVVPSAAGFKDLTFPNMAGHLNYKIYYILWEIKKRGCTACVTNGARILVA